jgi:tetratricopeptide (TPR) repeat protein
VGQMEDRLLAGDRAGARAGLAAARHEIEGRGHPYWRWVVETWGVLDLIIDGRLDEAEAAAVEALGWQADHPEALACLGVNLVAIRLYQGRSGEMVELLADAADENPHIPAYRAVLALCLAEAGALDEAERQYRRFADARFATIPPDTNWLLSVAVLADVCAALDDVDGGRLLLEQLRPHVGRQVVLNCFAGGGSYWGPVATQVGGLELVLGRRDAAADCFTRARAEAEAFEAPLALARIPAG